MKIPHKNVLLSSKSYSKTKYIELMNKISNKGKIFSLLILKQKSELSGNVSYETIYKSFGLNYSTKKKAMEYTKKYMLGLHPIVTFMQTPKKNSQEWLYCSIKIDVEDVESNFTQLPCDLLEVPGINPDLLVVFTVLNYYKMKHDNLDINPSYKTIAKIAGCGEDKIKKLLKQGRELNLWKYQEISGTRATNIYNISYYNKDKVECYYFRDELNRIEMEKQSIESYLNEKKAENS